ncbi:MAG: transposase [Thermoguttaceae bacterium]
MVFHLLNRGVGRRMLFAKDEDFLALERVVEESLRTRRMRLCAYCLMSNHWHFVVWPQRDGDLAAFMQHVTNMHVKRWKEHRHEIGYGHLYQGRYKCFPVETEDYFYRVARYVERNALCANLVGRAEEWPWSSLRRAEREEPAFPILSTWPLPRPADWLRIVNQPQTEAELETLRCCVNRGRPFGNPNWVADVARRFGHVEDQELQRRIAILPIFGGCHLYSAFIPRPHTRARSFVINRTSVGL